MQQVHGGNVYRNGQLDKELADFSINVNPLGMPESVKQAVRDSLDEAFRYPDITCQALREAIGQYEQLPAEWVLCGNGAAELIYGVAMAIRPEKVLLPVPTFLEYEASLLARDCQVEHFFLREKDGFHLQMQEFLERITSETDLVYLCNPNNPTGTTIAGEDLQTLLLHCQKTGTWLLVDECFVDFTAQPENITAREKLGQFDHLMILQAFTKRYAMAGIRLGYLLSQNRQLLHKLREVLPPWNVSFLAQQAGIAALREQEYVEQARALIQQERTHMAQVIAGLGEQRTRDGKPRYQVYDSQANYLFLKDRETEESGESSLGERAYEAGFLLRDCSNYPGLGPGFYRIAVKTPTENERLITWLRQL